jgi:uncharacterized protein (TIGR02145 family)
MKRRLLIAAAGIILIPAFIYGQATGTFTDPRDSVQYKTIQIGKQIWMAENFRATKYRNGDRIPNVTVNAKWTDLKSGAWCSYKNSAANRKVYGLLYNFYAISDSRKLAPEGWHVPAIAEWKELAEYLGGSVESGGKLKEKGTVHWLSPNTNATDGSGFSALPGGVCFGGSEQFYDLGSIGYWWSSTSEVPLDATHVALYNNNNTLSYYSRPKRMGYSVRLIHDK